MTSLIQSIQLELPNAYGSKYLVFKAPDTSYCVFIYINVTLEIELERRNFKGSGSNITLFLNYLIVLGFIIFALNQFDAS